MKFLRFIVVLGLLTSFCCTDGSQTPSTPISDGRSQDIHVIWGYINLPESDDIVTDDHRAQILISTDTAVPDLELTKVGIVPDDAYPSPANDLLGGHEITQKIRAEHGFEPNTTAYDIYAPRMIDIVPQLAEKPFRFFWWRVQPNGWVSRHVSIAAVSQTFSKENFGTHERWLVSFDADE